MYDIAVLGAGAAGCAAARSITAAHPHARVALIERGRRGCMPLVMRVPALQPYVRASFRARSFIRRVECVRDDNLAGRILTYVRGCGLGGSSLCNDMIYMRGTKSDFVSWNDPAWTWEAILPYYIALENNSRPCSSVHQQRGPLRVSDVQASNINSPLNVRFFEACEAAGVPMTDDFNGGSADGFSVYQSLVNNGARVDIFHDCLCARRQTVTNLDVLTETEVQRIMFEGVRAVGVEVLQKGILRRITAPSVVLCLGAIDSAALLQRSGVRAEGAVLDQPLVGRNLIQGCRVDIVCEGKRTMELRSKSPSLHNASYLWSQWREYQEHRTGIFTSFAEAAAFVRSQPSLDAPNLSVSFFATPQVDSYGWRYFSDGFTFRVAHHYPRSRGEVEVDPITGKVLIRSGLLRDKVDVTCMDEGIQWVGLIASPDSTLRSVHHHDVKGNHVGPFHNLGVAILQPSKGIASQKDTAAFLAEYAESTGHLFGTCALGSVVDSRLRVKGLDGVWVADASIVPTPTVASSPVLGSAIGSRVASFI